MLEKKRTYRLQGLEIRSSQLEFSVDALPGVLGKELSEDGHTLTVRYDLLKTNSAMIEAALLDQDLLAHHRTWFERISASLVHYLEQNERDNYLAKPGGCCSGTARGGNGPCCSSSKHSIAEHTLQPL